MSRSWLLNADTISSAAVAASEGLSPSPRARRSAVRRSSCLAVPDRSATLNRLGASSGKTSDRLKSAASGSSRRVTWSTTQDTDAPTTAACATQRRSPKKPAGRAKRCPVRRTTSNDVSIGVTNTTHRMNAAAQGRVFQVVASSSRAPRVGSTVMLGLSAQNQED